MAPWPHNFSKTGVVLRTSNTATSRFQIFNRESDQSRSSKVTSDNGPQCFSLIIRNERSCLLATYVMSYQGHTYTRYWVQHTHSSFVLQFMYTIIQVQANKYTRTVVKTHSGVLQCSSHTNKNKGKHTIQQTSHTIAKKISIGMQ